MKKVQRTLAAVLAAMMLMALAGCSKGDVTKEVNSGLSDLKAQAAEPAVEPQTETPAEPKTDAASEPASEPAAEPEPEATAEPAPASAPADNPDYPSAAGLNTQTLEAFGTDYTLVLNVTCPDQGWYKSASTSFGQDGAFDSGQRWRSAGGIQSAADRTADYGRRTASGRTRRTQDCAVLLHP